MLHGIVGTWEDGENSGVVMSGCLETTERGMDSNLGTTCEAHVKRLRCPMTSSSLIIGSHCGRSVFCSHLQCSITGCPCEQLAVDFLFQSQKSLAQYVSTTEAVIKEIVDAPLLLILSVGGELGVVTMYGQGDFVFTVLSPGIYKIRYVHSTGFLLMLF
jgi:hypothetical protein